MTDFRLPDVGEGLTDAELVSWSVAVGDTVAVNDVLCEVETAKAVVELPSPFAGTIDALHVSTGETVPVGTALIGITERDAEEAASPASPPSAAATAAERPMGGRDPGRAHEQEPEKAPAVLVGSGPRAPVARRLHLRPRPPDLARVSDDAHRRSTPPARRLARSLGFDVAVLDAATAADETRIPVTGVRKATAAAMVRSAFTAPHVTEWLAVDVTAAMELVRELKQDREWADVRVTPLLLVAKALLLAIRRHPAINARWDDDRHEIVQFRRVNLGLAAATPRGLVVPNVKDSDRLTLHELAGALNEVVATARAGSTRPAALTGGTITITNIGALGVDAGTPILNPGEAAILAFGAVRAMPWVHDGETRIRQVAQLAMSFDHRLVDGELGSDVLVEVGRILADPGRALRYA